jgi:hypothetical protein
MIKLDIFATLADEGFAPPLYVEGREAIANLFLKNKRCGIYVLHFADGMAYVGQSVDAARRYTEHRRNHQDIQQLSFKVCKHVDLNWVEKHMREVLQGKGFTLRGVVGVVQLPGNADFDLVMDPADQERWLADISMVDLQGSRMVNPALRSTYTGKFERLRNKRYFADVVEVLRLYVEVGIPRARAAEDSFWSCSCLPKSNVYSRININWQEVLSAYEQDGEIVFSFHFARSHLECGEPFAEYFDRIGPFCFGICANETTWGPVFDESYSDLIPEILETIDFTPPDNLFPVLTYFFDEFPGIIISGHSYEPGGTDQIRFIVRGREQALNLLHEEDVIRAIRHFNLRLMRLGPSPYKSSHCLDLADLLVYE